VIGAVAGAWIGWLHGTRAIFARSFDAEEPLDLPRRGMALVYARRKRDRIITSGLYAVFCAAAVSVPLAALLR
jgi:hypothetical protein